MLVTHTRDSQLGDACIFVHHNGAGVCFCLRSFTPRRCHTGVCSLGLQSGSIRVVSRSTPFISEITLALTADDARHVWALALSFYVPSPQGGLVPRTRLLERFSSFSRGHEGSSLLKSQERAEFSARHGHQARNSHKILHMVTQREGHVKMRSKERWLASLPSD